MTSPATVHSLPRRVQPTWIPGRMAAGLLMAALTGALVAQPAGPAEPAPSAKPDTPVAREATRPPRALRTVSPKHPPELRKKLIAGDCEIECLISADGQVVRTKVLSSSQPEFGREAEAAVRQWEFQPGERNGQPIAQTVRIPFAFTFSPEEILEIIAGRQVFQQITETIIPAEQLPAWPKPKHIYLPNYPAELKGSGKRGKAVVSIIINKEGHVINPKIVKATYPEFGLPALATAVRLSFDPQLVGNKKPEPIYVSMDLQFDFTDVDRTRPAGPEAKNPPTPKKSGSD